MRKKVGRIKKVSFFMPLKALGKSFLLLALTLVLLPDPTLGFASKIKLFDSPKESEESSNDTSDVNKKEEAKGGQPAMEGFVPPPSFAPLVKYALPAVVNISSEQRARQVKRFDMPQLPPGSLFEKFFKDFFDLPNPQNIRPTSLGSGFIIDPKGYIVTNNHLIADAEKITVVLQDGTKLTAKIIGRDKRTDIALLKVEANKELPYLEWAPSEKIENGDWVIVIGNPFGLGGTTTRGIISARGRDISKSQSPLNHSDFIDTDVDGFIQTDAAINIGNSGGPMINMEGKVIGINTVIISPNGGNIGLGFAIPSATAEPVVKQLKESGQVKRGRIGVLIQPISKEIAENFGLEKPDGAMVARVYPGTPAEKAGIQEGDIILSFNGQEVGEEHSKLTRIVNRAPLDKPLAVEIWRKTPNVLKGQKITLYVTVKHITEPREEDEEASLEEEEGVLLPELGLRIANLTPKMRTEFGVKESVNGILILDVEPGSSAAEKGLRQGIVISDIDQEPVKTTEEALKKVKEAVKKGQNTVLLQINNGDISLFEALRIEKVKNKEE